MSGLHEPGNDSVDSDVFVSALVALEGEIEKIQGLLDTLLLQIEGVLDDDVRRQMGPDLYQDAIKAVLARTLTASMAAAIHPDVNRVLKQLRFHAFIEYLRSARTVTTLQREYPDLSAWQPKKRAGTSQHPPVAA